MHVLLSPHSISVFVTPESAGPAQKSLAQGCRGFTLIELLVALAVGAILVLVAVPSFRNVTLSNQLTTTANDMVGAIYTARMEAIKLNAGTQLCSNATANNSTGALGTACNTSTQTGAVYALTGTTTAIQIRAATAGISTPVQLSGDMTALRFTSAGLGQKAGANSPYTGTVVDICTNGLSSNNHRVITMTAGSIITTTTPPTTTCP